MANTGPDRRRPGDRLVQVGAVIFTAGLIAAVLVVVPFFFGRRDASVGLALATLLMPVGLGVALSGLLRAARAGRR